MNTLISKQKEQKNKTFYQLQKDQEVRSMQILRSQSRSIIKDPIEKRISQTRFQNHLAAIKNPYGYSSHAGFKRRISCDDNGELAMKMSRSKKFNVIVHEDVDPVIFENRSLVKKMEEIDKRKSMSLMSFKAPHTSQYKLQNQKLREQNKMFFDRIKQQRDNIKTKKQLKKQFLQVDKLIMHSRRIKEAIKKVKKDKRSINFRYNSHESDNHPKLQIKQRPNPTPLVIS